MALIACVIHVQLVAQPHWSRRIGGAGNEHISDVKVDASGAVFVTGEFSGTVTFAGQTFTSSGAADAFVARLDAIGNLIWFTQGGGAGIDRGIKLCRGPGNALAVVGEFMGTANFQGNLITSAGGGVDVFVAQLDAANGQIQWIRMAGGAAGADRPHGVSVSPGGQVIVAGEFRGAAQWGSLALTSTLDPGSGLPGADVFIACYSTAGVELWVKQGAAKYYDHAVDVVHDPLGNIYVCGQFSDTITFDVVHYNDLYNACFLLKLDAAGNEQWFRRFGGATLNQVRDMQWTVPDGLALTGDLQGNMVYIGNVSTFINGPAPYAYYLLRVDPTGELQAHGAWGSQSHVSARGLDQRADTVAVVGTFECRFDDLANHYNGPALFMATGDQDLFVARHARQTLALMDAQQFGGQRPKNAGQITSLASGDLLFCGSFERNLIYPCRNQFDADHDAGVYMPWLTATYCGDTYHGTFAADVSSGLRDGFVSRGYVRDRSPYDWFTHTDALCLYDTLGICINPSFVTPPCSDSVTYCGPLILSVAPEFSYGGGSAGLYAGPQLSFLWSTGSTSTSLTVNTTGNYSVQVTAANGCLQWTDMIHVTITPIPPTPTISDDVVVNTNTPAPGPIYLCPPDSAWLWVTNVQPGHTVQWTGPSGTVYNDSILVTQGGTYTAMVTSPEGCSKTSNVSVFYYPMVPMPALTADLVISYPQDGDLNDTVALCPYDLLIHRYDPFWYINGVPSALPFGLTVRFRWHGGPAWSPIVDGAPQQYSSIVTTEGWHVDTLEVMVTNAPCLEDTLWFMAVDSVYVLLNPPMPMTGSVQGPSHLCAGDTATLVGSCVGCSGMQWTGPGVVANFTDSIWLNGAGTYSMVISVVDTNGCVYVQSMAHTVQVPPPPTLHVTPPYGVICPDSNATLWTTLAGTQFIWFGPLGADTTTSNTYPTTEPGEYFLFMTDMHGCPHYTTALTISNYATPFLSVLPDAWLCPVNDSVMLQVSTSALNPPTWWAPLSGNALTQVVTQPGIYTCQVSACGITTVLSVEVFASTVDAQVIGPASVTLCPLDTVVLVADTGQTQLLWLPSSVLGPTLSVTQPGQYQLIAFDSHGCSDTSALVTVALHDMGPLLIPDDVTVCAGDQAMFVAEGPNINWYADPALTQFLTNNDSLILPGATQPASFYLVLGDSVCTVATQVVHLFIDPVPTGLALLAPEALCEGQPLSLQVVGDTAVTYTWTTPSGGGSGSSLMIDPVQASDQGLYTAFPQLGDCPGDPLSAFVVVHVPQTFELGPVITVCAGTPIPLQIPVGYSDPVWSNGATATAIIVQAPGTMEVEALDPNGCEVRSSVELVPIDCDLVVPNIFTPNGDGINDGWSLTGVRIASARLLIFNRWGQKVWEGDPQRKAFDGIHYVSLEPLTEGVYYYVIDYERVSGGRHEQAGYFQLNR